MKKILLIGAHGQMGCELQRTLATLGNVVACGKDTIDLSQPAQITAQIRHYSPDIIVNAAAYTAVDKAESEPERAFQINGAAPGIIAEEAKRLGALLVHYSTDYVFDGSSKKPYREDDAVSPINIYGKSKLQGETNIIAVDGKHLILRISWVYGWHGQNFMLSMLKLAETQKDVKVTSDQFGAPTWSRMIACGTAQLLPIIAHAKDPESFYGLYHMTSSGQASRYEFAQRIFAGRPVQPALTAVPTSHFPTAAKRPLYSILSNEKLTKTFGIALPTWQEGLKLCMSEPNVKYY